MTLWEQWTLINFIANKDYSGNVIEPDRFKQLAKIVNIDLFKVKFGLPEDFQPGKPYFRQYIDAVQRLTDETLFLHKRDDSLAITAGVASYPNDYFTLDSIRYNYSTTIDGGPITLPRPVEVLTEDEYSDRAGNYTKRPTERDPICVLREDGIYIYPASPSMTAVDFAYIRYPNDPVFDYTLQTGYIEEGGSPTEYEWPKHLHMDLTRRILSYIGINLREEELQSYSEQHKAQGD